MHLANTIPHHQPAAPSLGKQDLCSSHRHFPAYLYANCSLQFGSWAWWDTWWACHIPTVTSPRRPGLCSIVCLKKGSVCLPAEALLHLQGLWLSPMDSTQNQIMSLWKLRFCCTDHHGMTKLVRPFKPAKEWVRRTSRSFVFHCRTSRSFVFHCRSLDLWTASVNPTQTLCHLGILPR